MLLKFDNFGLRVYKYFLSLKIRNYKFLSLFKNIFEKIAKNNLQWTLLQSSVTFGLQVVSEKKINENYNIESRGSKTWSTFVENILLPRAHTYSVLNKLFLDILIKKRIKVIYVNDWKNLKLFVNYINQYFSDF